MTAGLPHGSLQASAAPPSRPDVNGGIQTPVLARSRILLRQDGATSPAGPPPAGFGSVERSTAEMGGRVSQVGVREKLAYASADVACNLVWITVGSYLLVFYTDVVGLPAGAVGTLLLVTRLVDALTDPAIGVMIDRTRTRWGASRPYFLWASVPLAALSVLAFSTPDAPEAARLGWAYATYFALTVVYGMANIPVTSILPALTSDPHERTTLGALRAFGAAIASVAAGAAFLPLVAVLGRGDDASGFRLAMALLALLSCTLLLFAFASLRERATAAPVPRLGGAPALRNNPQLYIALTAVLLLFLETTSRTAALVYFFRDYLGREDLVPLANVLRATVVIGLATCVRLALRIGKRNTLVSGVALGLAGVVLPIPFGTAPNPVLIGIAIGAVGTGMVLGLIFSMAADVIDYSARRSGVHAGGLIAATVGLAAKVGVALGGAGVAWILAAGGYEGGTGVQGEGAVIAIRFAFYGLPAVLLVTVLALMPLYRVDRHLAAGVPQASGSAPP